MKLRVILACCILFLASLPIAPQEVISARRRVVSGGGGTWSLVQFKYQDNVAGGTGGGACAVNTTSCIVNIVAPTAGNLLVAVSFGGSSGTATMTAPTGGQTWTHCAGTNACAFGNTTTGKADAWYVLSATATGQTTVTCNFSANNWSGAYNSCSVYEYHWSGASITFDTSNGAVDATCTTCAGVALTLGGTTDVIIQTAITIPGSGVTAISGTNYTNPKQFYSGTGDAGWINTSDGTAPNWTQGSSTLTVMALAFKGS